MAVYMSFDSLQDYLFSNIFCFETEFSSLTNYTGTFLLGVH